MLTIIQAAGWPIWFLLLCSIIGLALIIERAFSLRSAKVLDLRLREQAYEMALLPELLPEQLQRLGQVSPLGQLYAILLENRHAPEFVRRQAAEEVGSALHFQLHRYLPALGTVAVVAPLLGLFGTVIGMIEIFSAYTPQGSDPTLLANGIAMALYNTGFGIIIAVPALIFHRYYRSRADYLLNNLETEAGRFNRFIDQTA